MTPMGWILVIGIPILVGLIMLEGRRQERRHGKAGTGARLMRSGMLEMQSLLEPEKKVEMLLQEEELSPDAERAGAPPHPPKGRP